MRILLATGHPHIPQIAGGAQSSTDELARILIARGHQVAVAAGLSGEGWLASRYRVLSRLTGRKALVDRNLGYPVYRAWFIWDALGEVVRDFAPDVVLVQSGFPARLAAACQKLQVPVVVYQRNVEENDLGGDLASLGGIPFIANSQFTADWLKRRIGVQASVVYPLLDRSKYETPTRRENVTFINPHPLKGSAIALAVAKACPEIPFVFVEAWGLDSETRAELLRQIGELANVTLRPRTRCMQDVYGGARIVLAPSKWDEAFGRIAAEAHFSGIPVVASRRGGLPEAVGPGGLLIDADAPISEWVAAIRKLWTDDAYWQQVSAAARDYSNRDELVPAFQIDRVLEILAAEIARQRTAAEPPLKHAI